MRKSNLRCHLQYTPANILLLLLPPIANLLFMHYFFISKVYWNLRLCIVVLHNKMYYLLFFSNGVR